MLRLDFWPGNEPRAQSSKCLSCHFKDVQGHVMSFPVILSLFLYTSSPPVSRRLFPTRLSIPREQIISGFWLVANADPGEQWPEIPWRIHDGPQVGIWSAVHH